MLQKTTKIFIGKDITRDGQVSDGVKTPVIVESGNLVSGEIVILDKYHLVLGTDGTIGNSDVIYVCQGTGETFSYSLPNGTAVTSSRKVRMSDPIKGALVKSVLGKNHAVKSEQVTTITVTGLTPVVGTEYLIRIVYKDMNEHPGQFTQTYRYTATNATLATFTLGFMNKINAHGGRRVQATESSATTIVLTGLPIPGCTTGLSDFDKFSMVEFDAFLNYVDADGNWADFGAAVTTVAASYGVGTWEQVRDMEKECWGYLGVTNRTHYPVTLPDVATVVGTSYDLIVIEHDADYLSPDNQYTKTTPLTTILALYEGASQNTTILAALDPWILTLPGTFPGISLT
jgi:hypothetical protein